MQTKILNERPEDNETIEHLHDVLFGPARFSKAVSLIRNTEAPDYKISYLIKDESSNELLASLRMYNIKVGKYPLLLLGPLVVKENLQNKGLGSQLVKHTLKQILEAKSLGQINNKAIIMSGYYNYYKRFGFKPFPHHKKIILPAPLEPELLLIMELEEGIIETLEGKVSLA